MCFVFLKTVRLNKVVPGILLLSLLFFYDIFWVFYSTRFTKGGQSVMVAVASKFEAPIKLLMPHISYSHPTGQCSMLGLGDIVVPGIYIGFFIRINLGYTKTAIISYALALALCGICLVTFRSAQPALLYIVPLLVGSTLHKAFKQNDFQTLKRGIPDKEKHIEFELVEENNE
jgi:presenilin-like A22 family membrane protease